MADVEVLDDDRDTSLPSSALSPAEYRAFRGLVSELDHNGVNNQVSLFSVLDFLSTFNGVTRNIVDQIVHIVLGNQQGEFVGEGHIYAMIRLIGHWQIDRRIEKSLIFVQVSRVPERTRSARSSHEFAPPSAIGPSSTLLNPFRTNTNSSSSATPVRTADVDRGVEAFKRLMFSNAKDGSRDNSNDSEESRPRTSSSSARADTSTHSSRTDHTATGMTFVYSSDEEDDVGSSLKHSPETILRDSPQPLTTLPPERGDRKTLPALSIPHSSPQKPAPPPSRKRGVSNPSAPPHTDGNPKTEEKPLQTKRNLPPVPPAPRRTLSSTSGNQTPLPSLERSTSVRHDKEKPPPPKPRRKLSDTSVTSTEAPPPAAGPSHRPQVDLDPPVTSPNPNRRLSTQAPPPPPPPRGRKMTNAEPGSTTPIRRSTEIMSHFPLERAESPRRSSAPEHEKPTFQDSDLSLELGRLQKEVDELVYGLTRRKAGT